jgi:hypothetical protein
VATFTHPLLCDRGGAASLLPVVRVLASVVVVVQLGPPCPYILRNRELFPGHTPRSEATEQPAARLTPGTSLALAPIIARDATPQA